MIERSLKIFLRELKKFCNTFYSDFFTLFDEYPSLINILMLVIIVKWLLYTWGKCYFKILNCQYCLKIKMKIIYYKSVCPQSVRNRILPSYTNEILIHVLTSFVYIGKGISSILASQLTTRTSFFDTIKIDFTRELYGEGYHSLSTVEFHD